MSRPHVAGVHVTDGLPKGWTFTTIEQADTVTYEVRTAHKFIIMSSTWLKKSVPTYGHEESTP